MDDPDSYMRRVLLRCLLDERRRPWRREVSWDQLPEQPRADTEGPAVERAAIVAALAQLPPRRRAVVVLRYFCDLSVEQTAIELDCTPGTVKSQTARALLTLRETLGASSEGMTSHG
ncbi:sigma-70 family RNA polymerase sigma factor [Paractinoplanes atraurantiacus]|uniref:RNA polymerase sigma factor, sigma-70 family n=1 Tax=Paractinoplanes atraurantiacus TaxID=1036182 RepID=A0A285HTX3_9ACTN|nr:sigma-70 family RNA polymerase sigma factor [Actinoplanes atraurantiacus]SNY39117.1 RNA polymerase sigma factor, sigma-70 family [Actinoplanes atraurantiacus]